MYYAVAKALCNVLHRNNKYYTAKILQFAIYELILRQFRIY